MPSKKILIISEAHLVRAFVQSTVSKLKEETGANFDCLITTAIDDRTLDSLQQTFDNVYVNKYPKGFLKLLPKIRTIQEIYGVRKLTKKLKNYDIIHIHYHYYYYSFFTPIIRIKASKFFLTFLGDDFNDIGNFKHWLNKKTVSLIDGVFATNETFLKKIIQRYNISDNARKTGILIPLIDCFISFESFLKKNTVTSAKRIWHFEKGVIVCGYNAAMIMQHELIIDALNLVKSKLSGFKAIFPMTYGWRADQIKSKVKERLKTSFFDSLVLEDYLTIEQLHALRLAADIFINIPSRDQMASSMLEHLAAGSVVIAGKWLPYESLIEKGLYFITIETPYDLPRVLFDVLENLEEYKNRTKVNREKVLSMMSWETIKTNWYTHYELNND